MDKGSSVYSGSRRVGRAVTEAGKLVWAFLTPPPFPHKGPKFIEREDAQRRFASIVHSLTVHQIILCPSHGNLRDQLVQPPLPTHPHLLCFDAFQLPLSKKSTQHAFGLECQLKIHSLGEFPGGPVVRTPCFHCRGHGFDP